ncbi:hypothetical protein [Mycobacterium sp. GA-2829]|uniref:hypothetical protein n=1 Tax=Mycobacterium sp. GA-2829 TaxID=1772283 RepID=UPI001E63B0B6|nr:hypothetical protein [Mycobacterium sp. GA-2829]
MGTVIIDRVTPNVAKKTDGRLAARLAAIASFGGAMIHFAVLPAHLQEWTPSGLFFASIALFQLVWALVAPARPAAIVLAAGIMANVGAAALWVLSRTAGGPFGPHAGEPEVVEAAGLFALLLECYVVMGAGWMWYRGHRAVPISGFGNAIVLGGGSTVIAAAAALGVASGLLNDHHAPAGAKHDYHAPMSGHADGHHDHPEPAATPDTEVPPPPTAPAPVEPPPPATDLSHETDGGHHHSE